MIILPLTLHNVPLQKHKTMNLNDGNHKLRKLLTLAAVYLILIHSFGKYHICLLLKHFDQMICIFHFSQITLKIDLNLSLKGRHVERVILAIWEFCGAHISLQKDFTPPSPTQPPLKFSFSPPPPLPNH